MSTSNIHETSGLKRLFPLLTNENVNMKKEIMAGITTFLTMAYIIAVNPSSASVRVSLPAISFCKRSTVSLVGKASCKPEKGSLDIRMGGVSAAVFKLRD